MKSLLTICLILSLVTVLVAACGGSTAAPGGSGNSGSGITVVHLSASDFVNSHVTLHKGDSLRLIDDVASVHIVTNGTYVGSTIKTGAEHGAPLVNQQFNGSDTHVIGPFTTVGIFQFYCTVHLGMNLTVTVQ